VSIHKWGEKEGGWRTKPGLAIILHKYLSIKWIAMHSDDARNSRSARLSDFLRL
jgi:hypothetical protein